VALARKLAVIMHRMLARDRPQPLGAIQLTPTPRSPGNGILRDNPCRQLTKMAAPLLHLVLDLKSCRPEMGLQLTRALSHNLPEAERAPPQRGRSHPDHAHPAWRVITACATAGG